MRIQSKFKDYYDHVASCYGQDPDVVYERKSGIGCEIPWNAMAGKREAGSTILRDTFENYAWGGERGRGTRRIHVGSFFEMEFLVAGPHCFAIARHKSGKAVLLGPGHDRFLEREQFGPRMDEPRRPALPTPEQIVNLIHVVKAPVFLVRGWCDSRDQIRVFDDVPILADLGIPAVVPPEQMWQDIYSTIINVLRRNPDKAPPVEVDNQHKIWAAGMDPKTSFRHPVNPKPKRKP